MRAAAYTFGCKQNQVESGGMEHLLACEGFTLVPFEEPADIYLVNTCTVTGQADAEARRLIQRTSRDNPGARVIVTGCFAQRDPQAVASLPGVRMVLGNHEKPALVHYLREVLSQSEAFLLEAQVAIHVSDMGAVREHDNLPSAGMRGHTRAFLKIQDGCNLNCSYCIIPSVRGRSRSQPLEQVLRRARAFLDSGYQELVLTGIHIGSYGRDLPGKKGIVDLLEALVALGGFRRIRLSSLEPSEFSPELVNFIVNEPAVCRHFHIPFQSGSPRILRAMRRPYDREYYLRLLEEFFSRIPDVGISGDLIVGFPGETDEEFEESVNLVNAYPFASMHVFSYSDRDGTAASKLGEKTPKAVVRERSRVLRNVASAVALAFRRTFEGRTLTCQILNPKPNLGGRVEALADNYVRTLVLADPGDYGQYRRVRIEESGLPFCQGRLLDKI